MAVQVIIWDLDGTLVESIPGIAAALNQALEKHDLPVYSLEIIRGFIGDGSWMLCKRAATELSDLQISDLEATFKTCYQSAWKTGTVLYDGIHDLLEKCQRDGVKLAVLSNKPHNFTVDIVATLFPTISFDIVMGQQQGIAQKPAPDSTLICLEKLNLEPKNCLFIGDSTIDIETANAAGTASAAVTWGYHDQDKLQSVQPDYMAHDVKQLGDIIFA